MKENKKKELVKFIKDNYYNHELKDIYLREILDHDKEYE